MRTSSFTTPLFNDMHVHLRQAGSAAGLLREHARHSAAVMAMPNTNPPLDNAEALRAYLAGLSFCGLPAAGPPRDVSWVKLAFAIREGQTADDVAAMASCLGVAAGKLYPQSLTTNSGHGISWESVKGGGHSLDPVFGAMQDMDLVLCLHAEAPFNEVKDLVATEVVWWPFIRSVLQRFGKLRVVVEHVTSAAMAGLVVGFGQPHRLACTVTPQHLTWTLGDLFDGGLRPMRFCKPLYKNQSDLEALWLSASASPNFFLGSDSAPHGREAKLCECGCAGVYSAPVLPEVLATLFEARGRLDQSFTDFTSGRAARFYRLAADEKAGTLDFRREKWVAPKGDGYATPWDGAELAWRASRQGVAPPQEPAEQQVRKSQKKEKSG